MAGGGFNDHSDIIARQAVLRRIERRLAVAIARYPFGFCADPHRAGPILVNHADPVAIRQEIVIESDEFTITKNLQMIADPDPQAAFSVFAQRSHRPIGQPIALCIIDELSILKPTQAAKPGANPNCASAIFVNRIDVAPDQSLRLRQGCDHLLTHTVKSLSVSPQPDVPLSILKQNREGHLLEAAR